MEQAIIDYIGMLGFPIIMCLLLFWFITKVLKQNTSALERLIGLLQLIYCLNGGDVKDLESEEKDNDKISY